MQPPAQVFKYFSANGALRFLQKWRLRLTPPDVFNDPFELRPFIRLCAPGHARQFHEQNFGELLREEYWRHPELAAAGISYEQFQAIGETKRDLVGNFLEALIPFVEDIVREEMPALWAKNVGILCLTEEPTNLLMWAHYADSHQGACIAFNPTASCFNRRRSPEDEFGYLRQVNYAQLRPDIELASCENGLQDFLTKSDCWSYEREWRMLMPLGSAEETIEMSPKPIALFDCPPNAVIKVIVGARATSELATEIASVLASKQSANHVEIWKATLSDRHYRIDLLPS